MPIYEYKCRECGELSEFRISAQSDTEKLICKKCGSHKLDRKISVPSIASVRNTPSGQTCCGNPGGGCSTPGSCCGH
jgi:putative FmdB family regulatory protein